MIEGRNGLMVLNHTEHCQAKDNKQIQNPLAFHTTEYAFMLHLGSQLIDKSKTRDLPHQQFQRLLDVRVNEES